MKQYLLKISGLVTLILLLHSGGYAQQMGAGDLRDEKDTAGDKLNNYDEIIIKRKSDKDAKVTVEIKDGQVLVNGKPVSEFSDDDLSVRKKKIRIIEGRGFTFSAPEGAEPPMPPGAYSSPFRQGQTWNIDGDAWVSKSNKALLGVVSGASDNEGAKVKEVSKGSAAEKAGIKPGDLITKVDEVAITDPQSLSDAVHKYKPEDKVVLTFKRDGKEQKVTATLGKSKVSSRFNDTYLYNLPKVEDFNFQMPPGAYGPYGSNGSPRLGIKAQDTEDGKGVKVLEVGDESAAEKAGVKEGDVITRFDGKDVSSATALAELARAAKGKPSVKINLLRDGKPVEVEIKTPRKLRTADL